MSAAAAPLALCTSAEPWATATLWNYKVFEGARVLITRLCSLCWGCAAYGADRLAIARLSYNALSFCARMWPMSFVWLSLRPFWNRRCEPAVTSLLGTASCRRSCCAAWAFTLPQQHVVALGAQEMNGARDWVWVHCELQLRNVQDTVSCWAFMESVLLMQRHYLGLHGSALLCSVV